MAHAYAAAFTPAWSVISATLASRRTPTGPGSREPDSCAILPRIQSNRTTRRSPSGRLARRILLVAMYGSRRAEQAALRSPYASFSSIGFTSVTKRVIDSSS